MKWEKRNSAASVEAVVTENTGLSKDELLNPKFTDKVTGLYEAISMIESAITAKEHITIVGDYDCDGVTSSSILVRWLRAGYGYDDVTVRLPKRFSEGYGLSMAVIDEIESGLIITVDNGIAAFDEVGKAKAKGLKVVIIDHHLLDESKGLPNADVIIDPNAVPGSDFNFCCGAGLAYKVAVFSKKLDEATTDKLCALAAIGTVADVVPLIHDNRYIVKKGLAALNKKKAPLGVLALLRQLKIEVVTEDTVGFKIGPTLNAPGRLQDDGARQPFELLSEDKAVEKRAEALVHINETRKELVTQNMTKAKSIIAEECLFGDAPLIVYTDNKDAEKFHEGLVGILAGRLAEEVKVPVLVLTAAADDPAVLKGSGRSYGDVNLKELLDTTSDYLIRYGGHAGAVGLQIETSKAEDFRAAIMDAYQAAQTEADEGIEETAYFDLEIAADDVPNTITEVKEYAPYGEGNPRIIFKVRDYKLSPRVGKFYSLMGDGSTIKLFGSNSSAIGFGFADAYRDAGEPMTVDLYGTLGTNTFMGRTQNQVEIVGFETVAAKAAPSALAGLLASKMAKL